MNISEAWSRLDQEQRSQLMYVIYKWKTGPKLPKHMLMFVGAEEADKMIDKEIHYISKIEDLRSWNRQTMSARRRQLKLAIKRWQAIKTIIGETIYEQSRLSVDEAAV